MYTDPVHLHGGQPLEIWEFYYSIMSAFVFLQTLYEWLYSVIIIMIIKMHILYTNFQSIPKNKSTNGFKLKLHKGVGKKIGMLCDLISVHEWNIRMPASYNKEPQLSTDSTLWSTWGNIKLTTALGFLLNPYHRHILVMCFISMCWSAFHFPKNACRWAVN